MVFVCNGIGAILGNIQSSVIINPEGLEPSIQQSIYKYFD